MRGLKLVENFHDAPVCTVAPLAGAWIETSDALIEQRFVEVAPLAGAWIETTDMGAERESKSVAPLAGAWIETDCRLQSCCCLRVAPLRVRGLKPSLLGIFGLWVALRVRGLKPFCRGRVILASHLRVRGLKPSGKAICLEGIHVAPLRVRGLKQGMWVTMAANLGRTLRVRGLKHQEGCQSIPSPRVAPLAGAWIETIPSVSSLRGALVAPCGCVD